MASVRAQKEWVEGKNGRPSVDVLGSGAVVPSTWQGYAMLSSSC
jgi:hypothetical protein